MEFSLSFKLTATVSLGLNISLFSHKYICHKQRVLMAKINSETLQNSKEICQRTSTDKAKLCGYLKKKRNKVGGWRKLWFVLHDRLLLGYSSKEDYDNKLVSFKDVLNLVPGTQVRPMDGYRFTIETTTQIIYTFHCDDRTAYHEWMKAMLMLMDTSAFSCSRRFYYFAHDSFKTQSSSAEPSAFVKSTKNIENYSVLSEFIRKPQPESGRNERQTLKKQIERMSISGNEECRIVALTPSVEKHSRFQSVTTQNTEHSLLKPSNMEYGNTCSQESKVGEPIYAVVNLKHKYDQRKKRSELIEDKRCSSYESICRTEKDKFDEKKKSLESLADIIYEDGDLFFNTNINGHKISDNSQKDLQDTEENIYEPIDVSRPKTSMFEFRKYIERFKFHTFLRKPSTTTRTRTDARLTSNCAISRFTTLRWKLRKHRKSMQKRMRKLYTTEYEPGPLFQNPKDEILSDAGKMSNTDITRVPKNIKKNSKNEENTKVRSNDSNKKFETLQPSLKKAVAKLPLFIRNSSLVQN